MAPLRAPRGGLACSKCPRRARQTPPTAVARFVSQIEMQIERLRAMQRKTLRRVSRESLSEWSEARRTPPSESGLSESPLNA